MREQVLNVISTTREWYRRFERPLSSVSLFGGFIFDGLTLKRVDLFWENFWVVAHLVAAAICIVLVDRVTNEETEKEFAPTRFWLVNLLQFCFGGLLSTFLVFYFRSATFAVSWPFFLILGAAFTANESLKKHFTRLSFQVSLFFLSLFSFAIFLVPLLVHRIGPDIFLLSGAASLVSVAIFLLALESVAGEKFSKSKRILFLPILGIFAAMNVLYFFHLIPPIPLSLRDGGVYHSLMKSAGGDYVVQGEDQGLFSFFKLHEEIHLPPGSPVYAYSAVFSPAAFNTAIVHEWQWYDTRARRWVNADRITLSVLGGRDGGYRTYSMKTGLANGMWRVNVETARGEILGRLRFRVIPGTEEVAMRTELKD